MTNTNGSLIQLLTNDLSPIHFGDRYSIEIDEVKFSKARDAATLIGSLSPQWVQFLMNLRNRIVKNLGLKTTAEQDSTKSDFVFIAPIIRETHSLIVFGLDDSHLDFRACIGLENTENYGQLVSIETVVRFNNRLGRLYFFFIKPFHKLIVVQSLKKLASNIKTDRK